MGAQATHSGHNLLVLALRVCAAQVRTGIESWQLLQVGHNESLSVCLLVCVCLPACVCVYFLEIMTAQQKIVDSYARLRCANSSGSKSGKLLVHAANIGNSGPKPAFSYVLPLPLPAYMAAGAGRVISPRPYAYAGDSNEATPPMPDSQLLLAMDCSCCSSCRSCRCCRCCCSCCWAINQRAKVKHWLTIQSTDLNWRIYLPNERRRRWQWRRRRRRLLAPSWGERGQRMRVGGVACCILTRLASSSTHTRVGIKLGDSPNYWVVSVVACSRAQMPNGLQSCATCREGETEGEEVEGGVVPGWGNWSAAEVLARAMLFGH